MLQCYSKYYDNVLVSKQLKILQPGLNLTEIKKGNSKISTID